MFKPTADNYEALTRAKDYLLQILEDVPKDVKPNSVEEDIRIYINDAIDDIDNILFDFIYLDEKERSE